MKSFRAFNPHQCTFVSSQEHHVKVPVQCLCVTSLFEAVEPTFFGELTGFCRVWALLVLLQARLFQAFSRSGLQSIHTMNSGEAFYGAELSSPDGGSLTQVSERQSWVKQFSLFAFRWLDHRYWHTECPKQRSNRPEGCRSRIQSPRKWPANGKAGRKERCKYIGL